ncbi:hypothetical protein [Saccharopolyspora flava]|uniref:CopG family transcriptional regulator n=1 Tax=Saccharopolyspora flava TaxID=95161 RepID=A0A1I6PK09_9PSEU|nr:hypothetical protein [Saccharopolyspora flava]SFS40408.1 hypothetical protein SAMN05660874_00853 [Saccharopolyspora flava]
MTKLDKIAEYYDTHDMSEVMESGHWVEEPPEPDPVITTSLRLPKSLLDRVRDRAAADDVTTTAWIRGLIEAELERTEPHGVEARLQRLEDAVFTRSA